MKFYELTYIVEGEAEERLEALGERYKEINGWNEKQILQFAVTAMHQTDIDMKLQLLEEILRDLEKGK